MLGVGNNGSPHEHTGRLPGRREADTGDVSTRQLYAEGAHLLLAGIEDRGIGICEFEGYSLHQTILAVKKTGVRDLAISARGPKDAVQGK